MKINYEEDRSIVISDPDHRLANQAREGRKEI